jgi:hypothetical protein
MSSSQSPHALRIKARLVKDVQSPIDWIFKPLPQATQGWK